MEDEPKVRWNDLSDEQKDAVLATEPDEARFWTGLDTEDEKGEDVAKDLAEQDGGKTLEMKLDAANIDRDSLNEEAPTLNRDGKTRSGWDEASEKFAKGASGEVKCYEGDSPRKNSTFNKTEAPELNDNTKVNSLTKEDASGKEKENGKYTRNSDGTKLENSKGENLAPSVREQANNVKSVDSGKSDTAPSIAQKRNNINLGHETKNQTGDIGNDQTQAQSSGFEME